MFVCLCVSMSYGTEVNQMASPGTEEAVHHEGHQPSPLCLQPCCQTETVLTALCDSFTSQSLSKH